MVVNLPLILAVAGCVALLAGLFGGGVKAKEVTIPRIARLPRLFSGLAGLALIGLSTWLYVRNPALPAEETPQPTEITSTVTPAPTATTVPTQSTAPRIYDFAACLQPCEESNGVVAFPSKTTNIYIALKYENIPAWAHVVRTWEVREKNQVWATYDCTWSDPPSGIKHFSLYDVKGLTSGTWELTISVNGAVLLQQQIFVQGNWLYWAPAGTRSTCF